MFRRVAVRRVLGARLLHHRPLRVGSRLLHVGSAIHRATVHRCSLCWEATRCVSWSAACRVLECRLPRLGLPFVASSSAVRRVGVPLPPRRVLECRLPRLAVPVRHVLGSSRCVVS